MRLTVTAVLCVVMACSLTEARRGRRSADLNLSVEPALAQQNDTSQVDIACSPPESVDDVFMSIMLFLTHKEGETGSDVMIAQQTTKDVGGTVVMATGNMTGRVTAEGSAQSFGNESPIFLNVVLSDPQPSDSGIYSCKYIYLDTSYQIKVMTADATLDVEAVNVTEVVEIIPVAPVVVPVPVVEVVEEVCNCSVIMDEIDGIRDTLLIENAELKAKLEEKPVLAPVVAGAVDAKCQVSFSAGMSVRGIPLVDGSTIPFNQAISNKGEAFNTGSGVFVAPCDGQYYFSITLRSYQYMDSGTVEASIVAGDKTKVRTNVFSERDTMHYETAGATAVLSLAKGEEVKVKVTTTSSGQVMGGEYTIFTGFYLF